MNRAKLKNNLEVESDESNSSQNQMDLSLLRKPIKTSVEGFEEVLRAYEAGTNELRKLLSKECDLIYECKVCRNIFRSLTNFISHKRVYCRSSFNSANHFHFASNKFTVQDISTIIQAEQKNNAGNPKFTSGSVSGGEEKSKDLSGIVEHLLWKQHQSRNSNVNDIFTQNQTGASTSNDDSKNKKTLMLNRVNDSDVAVFQSILTDNDNSNMKDEINEVHNMLNNSNTILGPDGKVLNLFNSNSRNGSPALSTEGSDVTPATCQLCNLQFETQKMLKVHVEIKHNPSSYVYTCPSCPQKFSSSAAVIRHLSNDHKKSNRRIRLMRDNIIKKRMRADEVVSKPSASSSREVQKLQESNGGESSSKDDTVDWNEHDLNSGGVFDDSYKCPSCLKKFERKAVYTSHVQMCSDIKDREIEKMKKRKAKDGTKIKNLLNSTEIEENSNISEEPKSAEAVNKRKRKRTSKIKTEVEEIDQKEEIPEDSSDVVDWNLDDEEEKKKIENIKKEIIEDEYKKMEIKIEPTDQQQRSQDENEESALIIDEKAENATIGSFKCPQCEKVFETDEKLKVHLTCYHSRQKRFRCKICDYQGYRKKDTLNHINFVHQAGVTPDKLMDYIETVNKAVDEAEIAKQKEIKKGQTKLKRQLARQMQRKKIKEEGPNLSQDENEQKVEFKAPEIPSIDSTPTNTPKKPILSPPMQISPTKSDLKSSTDDEEDESYEQNSSDTSARRKSSSRACKNTSSEVSPDQSNQRPIRTRVKPVNKDFLYDLRDLLKKEQEAHRELSNSSNLTGKRELRKRAMSTNIRETFETPIKQETLPTFVLPSKSNEDSPAKNRRMSVFVPSSRPMYTPPVPVPRSPTYKPPPIPTHKNAGAAFKMALKAFDSNRASLYEPKYIHNDNYSQNNQKWDFLTPTTSTQSSGVSAASSILQKLSSGLFNKSETSPKLKYEPFELDIPKANTIDLSSGENNLMQLALNEGNQNVCVLQEISADSTDFNDDDSDSEPKLEIHSEKEVKKSRGRPRKNPSGKPPAKGHSPRLTVIQRLQENKIRKSREQLFQHMLKQQSEDGDDDEEQDIDSSQDSFENA